MISGVAMYSVGAHAPQADAFVETPALVQTLDGQYVAMARPAAYTTALRPAATPVAQRRTSAAAPRQTVYRTVEPVPSAWSSRRDASLAVRGARRG